MSNKKSLSQFIAEATLVHGDKCGYSKFIYNGTNTKGIIDCNICGDEFLQTPKKHLNGQRCPNCVNLKRLTIEDFIRKSILIHGLLYDYNKFILKNNKTKGIVICKIHGEFLCSPNLHLSQKQGCPKCGAAKSIKTRTATVEEFIRKAILVHGDKYNHSKFIYINDHTNGIIICNICGCEFLQVPSDHLQGHGCSNCLYKNEKIVNDYFISENILFLRHPKLIINGHRVCPDFYIPSLNLYVEYHGEQHYTPICWSKKISKEQARLRFVKQQQRDESLRQYCKENNFNLLEIDGRVFFGMMLKQHIATLFKMAA